MNLRKLEAFYLAAKYGTCSQAAEKLLISQPAVSTQIKDLERYYGVKLFVRLNKGLKLTKEGRSLYADAEKIFALSKLAENRLLEIRGRRESVLAVGTTVNYAKHVLPPFVAFFQSRYPNVKVVVREGTTSYILDSVINMENELAIVPHVRRNKDLSFVSFGKEEIFLVVSKAHRWYKRSDPVAFDELAGEKLGLREGDGSALRQLVLKVLKRHNIASNLILEGAIDFVKEMLKQGKAISFLDYLSVKEEVEEGIFKSLCLSSERLYLPFGVFFLGKDSLSIPAKDFLVVLRKDELDPRPTLREGLDSVRPFLSA